MEPIIVDTARRIARELSADDELRESIAEQCDRVTASPPGEERERAIDDLYLLLAGREHTRRRMDELLPDDFARFRDGLEGDPDVRYDRYACPEGDYVWEVFDVDEQPPTHCPHDGKPLTFVRADRC